MHCVRLVLLSLVLAACGDGSKTDAEPFATFEECFTEHHTTESFPTNQAIVICCLSHPIGSAAANTVCGADVNACTAYVTANITGSDATAADITAGCTDYVSQRGK